MNNAKEKVESVFSPFFFAYRSSDSAQGFFPPFYWRETAERETAVAFPLYWDFLKKSEDGWKRTQVFAPYFKRSSEDSEFKGLVPVYWARSKTVHEGTTTLKTSWSLVAPLYFRGSRPDGSRKLLTPLFSRLIDFDGREYGHTGLHFYSRDSWGGRTDGLFPVAYYRSEPDSYKYRLLNIYRSRDFANEHVQTSVWPVFRYRRDHDRRQVWFPIFYRDSDPNHSRGLVGTYYWQKDFDGQGGTRRMTAMQSALVPIFWHSN